jgi:hypothetical protein
LKTAHPSLTKKKKKTLPAILLKITSTFHHSFFFTQKLARFIYAACCMCCIWISTWSWKKNNGIKGKVCWANKNLVTNILHPRPNCRYCNQIIITLVLCIFSLFNSSLTQCPKTGSARNSYFCAFQIRTRHNFLLIQIFPILQYCCVIKLMRRSPTYGSLHLLVTNGFNLTVW